MRFTQGYAASPHCSPTRGSILTGQYPHRLHITSWIGGRKRTEYENLRLPTQRNFLPVELETLGEYFQARGFQTVQLGKWHLGRGPGHPRNHGFDTVIGWTDGAGPGGPSDWFGPYPKLRNLTGPPEEYITDRLTDEAIEFLETRGSDPFLMLFQHYDVHAPLSAPEEMVDRYVAQGRPRSEGRENATFLAMKEAFDRSFGRLEATLQRLGLAENTIVIVTSDNGGVSYFANNGPLRGGKKEFFEGGIRVPLMIRVPGMTEAGSVSEVPVSTIDFFPTVSELIGESPASLPAVMDGVSIVPALRGESSVPRETLYWHQPLYARDYADIPPQGVVMHQGWKLIQFYGETRPTQLFYLPDDLSEQTNLAAQHPEIVERMQQMLESHLQATDAQRVVVAE